MAHTNALDFSRVRATVRDAKDEKKGFLSSFYIETECFLCNKEEEGRREWKGMVTHFRFVV